MKIRILTVLLALITSLSFSACTDSTLENDINNDGGTENVTAALSDITEETVSEPPVQTVTAKEETTPAETAAAAEGTSSEASTSATTASTPAQTQAPQTTATVPAVTEPPAPQWSEAAVSGTMYISADGVYSRASAIPGSEKVKAYSLNQAVTVIAKTDTGYYKVGNGEYIHGDYLSTSKITAAVTTPKPPVTTTTTHAPETAAPAPAVTTEAAVSSDDYGRRSQTQEEIDFADKVFELVNAERAKENLAPLQKLDALTKVSVIRAWEIYVKYGHNRPNGAKFGTAFTENGLEYSYAGENIAAGQTTPEDVVNAWMNSQSHKDNILNPDAVYMGVGLYIVPGTEYIYYWAQNFYIPL